MLPKDGLKLFAAIGQSLAKSKSASVAINRIRHTLFTDASFGNTIPKLSKQEANAILAPSEHRAIDQFLKNR